MSFTSSTRNVPTTSAVPRHVAIIMDGNGRWARNRSLPRFAGHHRGVETVRATVKMCLECGIEYLTLFAFSSENWRRPQEEVRLLMQLFVRALKHEVKKLDRNGVRLRVVGDLSRFEPDLQALVRASEQRTAGNSRLVLTIAANYGGRWDILQAVRRMLSSNPDKGDGWDENDLAPHLAMSYAPEPDKYKVWMNWMLRSLNNSELIGLLGSMKTGAPSNVFQNILDITKSVIDSERWLKMKLSLGI